MMIRRIRLLGLLVLLVACGSAVQSLQSGTGTAMPPAETAVALASVVPTVAAPTSTATITPLPPTATPQPSPTPTTPTATVLPSATPSAVPAQAPVPAASAAPVRLQIPAIGLDEGPISVGLDAERIPIVPKHLVGWYNLSAMPGQGDNVVFWGHVLRWLDSPNVPAPFARMKELGVGAKVMVTTADGKVRAYRVTRQIQVKPSDVQYILPVGSERVTMVSCIGDTVITNGTLTKTMRLLTIAEPAT